MSRKTDQTTYIVLGISLIITALFGYLGYVEYAQQENLGNQLSTSEQAISNQRSSLNDNLERLRAVSEELGWKHQVFRADSNENQALPVDRHSVEQFPSITQLEEEGRLIEKTRKIMKQHGFSSTEIQRVTDNPSQAKQFLDRFFYEQSQLAKKSVTSLKAMGHDLNLALSLGPVLQDDPVEGGTLQTSYENDRTWSFSDDAEGFQSGSISEEGLSLSELLSELSRIRETLQNEISNLREENAQMQEKYFSYTPAYGDQAQVSSLIEESNTEIQNNKQQVQNLLDQIQNKRKTLLKTRAEAEKNLFQKQREKSEVLDQQMNELIAKKSETFQLERHLERLRANQERSTKATEKDAVDGQVLSASASTSTAFINIGRTDGLFIGQSFEVFNTGKGGRKIQKGEIKVTGLFDEYARAKIISQENPVNNPIESNDYIRNEDFTPGSSRTFVLTGRFHGNQDENVLKQYIRENGHRVGSEVSTNTSYVVIGSKYEDTSAYEKARELSIPIISPEKLKHMLDLLD